jgi:hypothetical protein
MALMRVMRVIEAEYAAIVDSGKMWQKEGKVVPNNCAVLVNPDLFAENPDPPTHRKRASSSVSFRRRVFLPMKGFLRK